MNGIAGFIKTADVFDKAEKRDLVGVLALVVIQNSHYLLPSPKQSVIYHMRRLHLTTMRLQIRGTLHASGIRGRRCWKRYQNGSLTLANPLSMCYLG